MANVATRNFGLDNAELEKSCRNDVSYEKFVRKMVMKLTLGLQMSISSTFMLDFFCTKANRDAVSNYVSAL